MWPNFLFCHFGIINIFFVHFLRLHLGSIWQNFLPILAKYVCYWADFHCCTWTAKCWISNLAIWSHWLEALTSVHRVKVWQTSAARFQLNITELRHVITSPSDMEVIKGAFLVQNTKIMWNNCPSVRLVQGFEPATSWYESPPITTRQGYCHGSSIWMI